MHKIARPPVLIASIGSLAILKVLPGKGMLTLCEHFLFPLALYRLHLRRKPSDKCLNIDIFEPHFGQMNDGYFFVRLGLSGAN